MNLAAAMHRCERTVTSLPNCPVSFPERNTGVIAYRNTAAFHTLMYIWLAYPTQTGDGPGVLTPEYKPGTSADAGGCSKTLLKPLRARSSRGGAAAGLRRRFSDLFLSFWTTTLDRANYL